MKKFLTNIMLAGFILSASLYPSSIKDPVTLSNWLRKNIIYKYDENDHWQSPQETLKLGTGDCEDFAILSKYILKKNGYKVFIIAIEYKTSDPAHAMAIIRHKDKTFSYFDNQYYFSKRFKSVRKLLDSHSMYSDDWKKAWLVISKHAGLPLWRNE